MKGEGFAHYLALDLGAESGRGILGTFADNRLNLEEVHRFPNGAVMASDGSLRWNLPAALEEIRSAITAALAKVDRLNGLAVDTWGVDYGLLDSEGKLLELPYHYRDARTEGMMQYVFQRVPREEIYRHTGIQFMELNTLYQLAAAARSGSTALEQASTLLLMPDLVSYHLCGAKSAEFTIATTTQCYDPRARDWARDLLARIGIPTHIFPEIVPPATPLGEYHDAATAGRSVPVFATAGHDTACAVAAVPAEHSDFAYLSCGTWSLLGTESPEPVITDAALDANFTNEGGVNCYRFLKNIAGLWVLQECRREWMREEGNLGWDTLISEAEASEPFRTIVDPDDPAFLRPADMPQRVLQWCQRKGADIPQSRGAMARAILEGLAMRYRMTLEQLRSLTGRSLGTLHIVGGGSRNRLLCRMTADCTGCLVVAGPPEATAAGNILVQAMATGDLESLQDARALFRQSISLETYEPKRVAAWDDAYDRFLHLVRGT